MLSLRAKLSVSYILVALVCVLLISILANVFLDKQFRVYILKNLDNKNKQVVSLISRQYSPENEWNHADITEIGINALEQGLIIKLQDTTGRVIWDATVHNNGLCQEMIMHMAQNMASRYPNWKGSYVENRYPIVYNFKTVGMVQIGYYGPFYFNDTDLSFINTLNQLLMGVTVLALFLALMAGGYMAKRLSTPISKVINTARQIAGGNLEARSLEKTNVREINQLTTAINDLAETLQQQESLRKRLTADVAHELRTPLATLQSHLEAMIDGIWKFDLTRLKSCHEEILRINRMVKDLERLAKYERETLDLNKTQFDLMELMKQVVMNFETEFQNKGVKLNLAGAEPLVYADRDKISQVMINLISNALKFTPKGGEVGVTIEDTPGGIKIRVKDNGAGIAPGDLPYIFERFYRADQSRNRMTGGTGIGLAIVKAIVEAHQGSVTVESEVGVGSEFVVELPGEE
jgi:two-component system, OmpR family, sensor histidine kinase BaeS